MYLLNVFTLGNQRKNKKEYIKIGAEVQQKSWTKLNI